MSLLEGWVLLTSLVWLALTAESVAQRRSIGAAMLTAILGLSGLACLWYR